MKSILKGVHIIEDQNIEIPFVKSFLHQEVNQRSEVSIGTERGLLRTKSDVLLLASTE